MDNGKEAKSTDSSQFPKTIRQLIDRLVENPMVLGILRYGSRFAFEANAPGDVDLFVIVEARPDGVESLHFYVADTPVDLNVRTFADLRREKPLTEIDPAIADAEILFDRHGELARVVSQITPQKPPPLTEHEIEWNRFCQQHVIDKVKRRLDDEPILCALLLNTNIYWLIQAYFRVRSLPFAGEKHALKWLQRHEPAMSDLITRFYAAEHLAEKVLITRDLTDLVLEPIGGPWRPGELITFGTDTHVSDLKAKGERLFEALILRCDP